MIHKVKITGIDLKKIKFDFHKELNKAAEIVKEDIMATVKSGKGVKSSGAKGPLKKLAKSTIKAKSKSSDSRIRRHALKPLIGTGSMIDLVIKKATRSKQEAVLHPTRDDTYGSISPAYYGSPATPYEVAGYHQETRPWFAVSKDAEKLIEKMVSHAIDRILARAS